MKKVAVIGVVLALTFALGGCKKKNAKKVNKPSVTQQDTTMKMPKETTTVKDTTKVQDTTKMQDTTNVQDTTKAEQNNDQNNTAKDQNNAKPKQKIKKKIR